jgi:L-threonylcarbamoyladenylate synthase
MRLFAIKKRPLNQPIGIFVDSFEMLEKYSEITQKEYTFLSNIWPGPLTCILKKNPNITYYTTPTKTQMQTVAVRIPRNPVTRKLVSLMGEALLETSVNVSTQPFLLWENLLESYERFAQIMVSSGKETDNSPSTIIDLTDEKVKLIREGSFSWQSTKELLLKSGLEPDES